MTDDEEGIASRIQAANQTCCRMIEGAMTIQNPIVP
jgi:hypothetical protein